MKNWGRPEKTLIPLNFKFVLANYRRWMREMWFRYLDTVTFSCLLFRLKAVAISPVLWTMWKASRLQCDAAIDWLPEESHTAPTVNSHFNYSCVYCEITCCLGTAMIGWIFFLLSQGLRVILYTKKPWFSIISAACFVQTPNPKY